MCIQFGIRNIRRKGKRFFSTLLAFCLLLTLASTLKSEVQAAGQDSSNGILMAIETLKVKFPHNAYWNHLVENGLDGDTLLATRNNCYADSVTDTPCATHNGRAGNLQYDCNFYDGGLQCWGFACKIFNEIFKRNCASLPRRYDKENIAVGDYVRFGTDYNGHSVVVIGREGNTLTVVECNYGYSASDRCRINWGRKINLDTSSVGYYIHADNYEEVKNSGYTRPASLYYGNDFYAYILSKLGEGSGTILLTNISTADSQNVATAWWDGNSYNTRNIWHFVWDSKTSSYEISSVYDDGKALDVSGANDYAGNPIWTYPTNSTAAQRFRLIRASGNYFTMLPDCTTQGLVLDVINGSTEPNTPLQLWTPNSTAAQLFGISKLTVSYAKPSRPSQPTEIQALTDNTLTTISWKAVPTSSRFDKRMYEVIVDGASYTTAETNIVLRLSEGGHSVKIRAINTMYLDWSSGYTTKAFAVVHQPFDFSKEVISGCIPEPF